MEDKNIDDFLKRFVEGYLFHDLDNIATLKALEGHDDGAAGYPMIATIMAGIELLGGLVSQSSFSNTAGNGYFLDYWNKCLAVTNADYKNLGELFRKLIRHGLAHTFLAKHGILVTKRDPKIHAPTFKVDRVRNELTIDCVDFYNDFKKSYYEHIQPLIFDGKTSTLTDKATIQIRLNEMVALYQSESKEAFADYIKRTPESTSTTTTSSMPRASGASLPLEKAINSGKHPSSVPEPSVSEAFATTTFSGLVNKKKS
jgi:hypothetical protein